MKCFHEIKSEIGERCDRESSGEYQRNYIQPLVAQTRATVLAHCTMTPPYEQYFNKAPSIESHANYRHTLLVTVVALIARFIVVNFIHLLRPLL